MLRLAVGMVSHVDLPLDNLLDAVVKSTSIEVLSAMGTVSDLVSRDPPFDAESPEYEDAKRLHGESYAALCHFMHEAENPNGCCGLRFPWSSSRATQTAIGASWKDSMRQANNGRGGWVWVKNTNLAEYERKIAQEIERAPFSSTV